jgi:hypothetical protein
MKNKVNKPVVKPPMTLSDLSAEVKHGLIASMHKEGSMDAAMNLHAKMAQMPSTKIASPAVPQPKALPVVKYKLK